MSSPDPPLDPVHERVEDLAAENRWPEVFDLLSGLDRGRLLENHALAYRFGQSLYYGGRIDELSEFVDRFEASTRDSAAPAATMRALNLAGTAAFELGDVERAQRSFDRLMELAEAEDDTEMQARAANNLGAVAALLGRVDESLSCYRLAAPLYQRLNRTRGLAEMHHNMGIAHRDLDRLDEARRSFRKAASLAEHVGHTSLVVLATVGRAEVELRRGDVALAARLVRRGLENAREVGDPLSEADALRVRALVRASGDGDREHALRDLERARDMAEDAGNRFLRGEILRDRGTIFAESGDSSAARDAWEEALETFRVLGASLEAERVRSELDALDVTPT